MDALRQRISENSKKHNLLPVPTHRRPGFVPPKKLSKAARGSLVALPRHYLYLLGYYQNRGSPGTNARMHWLLREDIRKLDQYVADTRLLGRENIATSEQLFLYRDRLESEIDRFVKECSELKAAIRAEARYSNPYSVKGNEQYLEITRKLKRLRREVVQCKRVKERSRDLAGALSA